METRGVFRRCWRRARRERRRRRLVAQARRVSFGRAVAYRYAGVWIFYGSLLFSAAFFFNVKNTATKPLMTKRKRLREDNILFPKLHDLHDLTPCLGVPRVALSSPLLLLERKTTVDETILKVGPPCDQLLTPRSIVPTPLFL